MGKIIDRKLELKLELSLFGQLSKTAVLKVVIESDKDYVVGRAKGHAHIVLKDDKISRSHLKILKKGNAVYVRDLNTKNGTELNGIPLGEAEQLLTAGDEIKLGKHVLRVACIEKILNEDDITSLMSFKHQNTDTTGVGRIVNGYGRAI